MTTDDSERPPAGWYPDVREPGRLRWWDGARWTAQIDDTSVVAVSAPQTRLNTRSFAIALPVGFVAGFLLAPIAASVGTHSTGYATGESVAAGLMAGGLAGLLAWFSRVRWRVWLYPLAVVALWFVFFTLGNSEEVTNALGDHEPRVELTAPDTFGSLIADHSSVSEDKRAELIKAMQDEDDEVDKATVEIYTGSGPARVVFIGLETHPGSGFDHQTEFSPDEAVRDYATGAKYQHPQYMDAGPLGGSMMCGSIVVQSSSLYACTWAKTGTIGTLMFGANVGDVETAAEQSRTFRSLAEHALHQE